MSQKTSDVKGSVPPEHWFPQTLWSDPPGTQTPGNALHALHPQDNNTPSDSTEHSKLEGNRKAGGGSVYRHHIRHEGPSSSFETSRGLPWGGGAGHSARNNTGLMGEWGLAARARGRWRQEGTGASPRLPRRQDWYDGGEPGTSAGKLCAERTSHGITNLKDTWDFPCKGTRSPALSWVAGEGF